MFETYIKNAIIPSQSKSGEASKDVSTNWVWPKDDTGLWDGPSREWYSISVLITAHCNSKIQAVQAGGACGMYPKLLSEMFEQVYTFEPDQYNFYCLAQNCQSPNIQKFNCALGDSHTNIQFNKPNINNRGLGQTVIRRMGDPDLSVPTVPMLMVDDFDYQKLDLIYLDVEGSEYLVLKGSEKSIEKHRPLIILETVNPEIKEFLQKYNYEIVGHNISDTVFKHISI